MAANTTAITITATCSTTWLITIDAITYRVISTQSTLSTIKHILFTFSLFYLISCFLLECYTKLATINRHGKSSIHQSSVRFLSLSFHGYVFLFDVFHLL